MTTREQISGWLQEAKAKGATHMLVVCDTFDHSDYPVSVMPGDDVRVKAEANNGPNMTRLMEVYNLAGDLEAQLSERRSFNF
jgi:hypothetical protein